MVLLYTPVHHTCTVYAMLPRAPMHSTHRLNMPYVLVTALIVEYAHNLRKAAVKIAKLAAKAWKKPRKLAVSPVFRLGL